MTAPSAEDVAWLAAEQDAADAARSAEQAIAEMAERGKMIERHTAARRVHTARGAVAPLIRLDDETRVHPRGLHVPCSGDPESGDLGCRAVRGMGCRHPGKREVLGFVHPSRMRAEIAYITARNPGIVITPATV